MQTIPNIAYLASELSPYLAEALPNIATDLASKSIEATATAAVRGLRTIGASLSRKFRRARVSSKAYALFEKNWLEATTPSQREKAIRILLNEEPRFATSLDMLLLRRDFVIATASYCNRFPALDQDRILSDDYVPMSIRPLTSTPFSASSFGPSDITAVGNHIIEGDGGAGNRPSCVIWPGRKLKRCFRTDTKLPLMTFGFLVGFGRQTLRVRETSRLRYTAPRLQASAGGCAGLYLSIFSLQIPLMAIATGSYLLTVSTNLKAGNVEKCGTLFAFMPNRTAVSNSSSHRDQKPSLQFRLVAHFLAGEWSQ
ncbi:hypothetical protein [Achromobacter sp. Marseille-Q4954]|uniref:hypothetical protein n=1 Tax=Achromobacter sp. Marseille-Q4954 TaxID=2942203 RepID=UPI0020735496|nr:hypothetical protein [Achromobacter sp. Marseille-Q4954]